MIVRIATYNLFEGAKGSYNRLVEFVKENSLDAICLQEVNGWQDNDSARLKNFTDQILFAASAFGNSNTEYKLATASKHALTYKELHAEAFWHGALETRLKIDGQEIAIFNVHLDPWQEASRDKEITRLLAAIDPHYPVIITGDFNSLSRQDTYPATLVGQLQRNGITKYGSGQLEYGVIDHLLRAGFVDVAASVGQFDTTVPTAFSTDKDHEVPVRIDYMFVSPALAPHIKKVERVKNDLTDAISDHYPLIVSFQFGAPEGPERPDLPPVPGAPRPATPPKLDREIPAPSQQVVPWTPPGDAPSPPSAPPQADPPDDGEVVLWTHDQK